MSTPNNLLIGLLSVLALPSIGHAALTSPSEFGTTFSVAAGLTTPTSAYDADSDTYTVDADLGSVSDPAALLIGPDLVTIVASDLVATFALTANIDGSGSVLSGSYSWLGESASLGIAPGTVLMSGSITGVEVEFGFGIQTIGTVDVLNPALEAAVGPAIRVLIRDFQDLEEWSTGGSGLAPWSASFLHTSSFTGGPDLFASPVPEPASLLLFIAGVAGVVVACRRRA